MFTSFIIPLIAQVNPTAAADEPVAKPILILIMLVGLSLAPFLVMMMTSFVKITVVLSLIRTAIGTQQIPPNQIITGLALILTIYVMIPVGADVYDNVKSVIHDTGTGGTGSNQPIMSMASFDVVKEAFDKGKEPVRAFLMKHGATKDRSLFYNMAKKLRANSTSKSIEEIAEDSFLVIVPAFVVTELSEAFQIGFILFLPFLVIDMVVSNILLAMGMFMVSPVTISLPFKLLLFVLVDGWYLITQGLVMGYIN